MAKDLKNTETIDGVPIHENPDKLIDYITTDNSPFTIAVVQRENEKAKDYYLMMGKYRIFPNPFMDLETAKQEAESITWDKIMQIIAIMVRSFLNGDLELDEKQIKQ